MSPSNFIDLLVQDTRIRSAVKVLNYTQNGTEPIFKGFFEQHLQIEDTQRVQCTRTTGRSSSAQVDRVGTLRYFADGLGHPTAMKLHCIHKRFR